MSWITRGRDLMISCARLMRRVIIVGFAALIGHLVHPPSSARADDSFDFYVLSLSWSPTFCSGRDRRSNRDQCSRDLGFIVHGLWPQFERGYPENCSSSEPDFVPSSTVSDMADIMPGGGLVGSQWRKHGTCTGLTQKDYFQTIRNAHDQIVIPDLFDDPDQRQFVSSRATEAAFLEANPGMSAAGIAVKCDSAKFVEVRICMTKDLEFRRCREVDRRGCQQQRLLVPATGEFR